MAHLWAAVACAALLLASAGGVARGESEVTFDLGKGWEKHVAGKGKVGLAAELVLSTVDSSAQKDDGEFAVDVKGDVLVSDPTIDRHAKSWLRTVETNLAEIALEIKPPDTMLGGGMEIIDACTLGLDVLTMSGEAGANKDDPRTWSFDAVTVKGSCGVDVTKVAKAAGIFTSERVKAVLEVELSFTPSHEYLKRALSGLNERKHATKMVMEANEAALKKQGDLAKALKKYKDLIPSDPGYDDAMREIKALEAEVEHATRAARAEAKKSTKIMNKLQRKADRAAGKVEWHKALADHYEAKGHKLEKEYIEEIEKNGGVETKEMKAKKKKANKFYRKRLDQKYKARRWTKKAKKASDALANGGKRAKNFLVRLGGRVMSSGAGKFLAKVAAKFVPFLNLVGLVDDILTVAKVIYFWDNINWGWDAPGVPIGDLPIGAKTRKVTPADLQEYEPPSDEYLGATSDDAIDAKGRMPGGKAAEGHGEKTNEGDDEDGDGDGEDEDESGGGTGGGAGGGTGGGTGGAGSGSGSGSDGVEDGTEDKPTSGVKPGPNNRDVDDGGAAYTSMGEGDTACSAASGRCQRTTAPCTGGAYVAGSCNGMPDLLDRSCCVLHKERLCAHVGGVCTADGGACEAQNGFERAPSWACGEGHFCCAPLEQNKRAEAARDYSRPYSKDRTCKRKGGTCQKDTAECAGSYESYLCGGAMPDRRCCLPASGGTDYTQRRPSDATCERRKGTCQKSSLPCTGGNYVQSLCGGTQPDRMCCLPKSELKPGGGSSGGGGGGGGRGGTGTGGGKGDGHGSGDEDDEGDDDVKKGGGEGPSGKKSGTATNGDGGDADDFCTLVDGVCAASASDCAAGKVAEAQKYYCGGKGVCCLDGLPPESDDPPPESKTGGCPVGRDLCVTGLCLIADCTPNGDATYSSEKIARLRGGDDIAYPDGTKVRIVDISVMPRKDVGGVAIMGAQLTWELVWKPESSGLAMSVGERKREAPDIFWREVATGKTNRVSGGLDFHGLARCLKFTEHAMSRDDEKCTATDIIDFGIVKGQVRGLFGTWSDAIIGWEGTLKLHITEIVTPHLDSIVYEGKRYKFVVGRSFDLPIKQLRRAADK